ncbi:putative two-component response-regulatory protein YehT [uncultured Roseburia sp.]|uniref:Stage 0 sporulation protein A homolog n=1 Tax=Brotonthovivens ammoniilytica TaxID=2981725 RepID=A0ABT2TN34_9FIRM|nr:response regulator [Brotonthovivens ammoniilytica]MCU6763630.1 response regulator [Brotonthovivens ammoniilytica]SCJ28666.1 putative two-component response-regulatory protein YehT [uncultured Roseburia sp.]
MKAIIVDDEKLALKQFEIESRGIPGFQLEAVFTNPLQALDYLKDHPVEVVLSDIEMPGMNGIIFGKRVRELYPDIVFIIITGYEQYAMDAFKIKADYYLLKPYNYEEIVYVLKRAKLLAKAMKKRVRIRTFGRFDLFIDGKVVYIPNVKAKELLALCVDHRGGTVTMEEAIDKLWGERVYDEKVKNLYRKAVMVIRNVFKENSLGDVFVSTRGACSIDYEAVECDYFQYMDGTDSQNTELLLMGSYLSEYSWAEETAAVLEQHHGFGRKAIKF